MKKNIFYIDFNKNESVKFLTGIYFLIAIVEFISQYNNDKLFIYLTKPLLMPILIAIYWLKTKIYNKLFLISLIVVWIANLFFIGNSKILILLGSIFFLIYRLIILFIIKSPGTFKIILGSIPFLLSFIIFILYNSIGLSQGFSIFISQGIIIILFGGFVLGNYIYRPNIINTIMLISTVFITVAQFCFILIPLNNSERFGLLFFAFGQYLLYRYAILVEKVHSHRK